MLQQEFFSLKLFDLPTSNLNAFKIITSLGYLLNLLFIFKLKEKLVFFYNHVV